MNVERLSPETYYKHVSITLITDYHIEPTKQIYWTGREKTIDKQMLPHYTTNVGVATHCKVINNIRATASSHRARNPEHW